MVKVPIHQIYITVLKVYILNNNTHDTKVSKTEMERGNPQSYKIFSFISLTQIKY